MKIFCKRCHARSRAKCKCRTVRDEQVAQWIEYAGQKSRKCDALQREVDDLKATVRALMAERISAAAPKLLTTKRITTEGLGATEDV